MHDRPPGPPPDPHLPLANRRLLETGAEGRIRDWLQVASVFTGAGIALVLQDEQGVWYRDGVGLGPEQLAEAEQALGLGLPAAPGPGALGILASWPLVDAAQRPLGTICACAAGGSSLSPEQRTGLALVVRHLQDLLANGRDLVEKRAPNRSPSAASFVPGLVHELGSFIFGISANLDAFEARFAGLEEVGRYGLAIRRSLDRMNAFIDELRAYGEPRELSRSLCELPELLERAVMEIRSQADRRQVALRLETPGPMPALLGDARDLAGAFSRLLGFLIQHEEPGGCVVLSAGVRQQGTRTYLGGYLEGSALKSQNADLGRLFEPFYFRTSGLGRLALPVARRIIETHGGCLTAAPGTDGRMRLQFQLPVAPAAERPAG